MEGRRNTLYVDFFTEETQWKGENWLKAHKIPVTMLGLQEVERWQMELREQKECFLWKNKIDQFEIQQSINGAQHAYDYIYSRLFKDHSNNGYAGGQFEGA